MKRGTRYSDKVIAFALTERGRGARWKDIQDGIRQQFQIKPPSERQMRAWYKDFGGGSADPEKLLRETLLKVGKAAIPAAAFATDKLYAEQGVPTLIEVYKQGGDLEVAGAIMILSVLEQRVGTETYEKAVMQYQQMRERRGK